MIDYRTLADLYAEIGIMDHGVMSAHAAVEAQEASDVGRESWDALVSLDELISTVPDPTVDARVKHDDTCWLRHVPCFAARVHDIINGT